MQMCCCTSALDGVYTVMCAAFNLLCEADVLMLNPLYEIFTFNGWTGIKAIHRKFLPSSESVSVCICVFYLQSNSD